MPDQKEHERIEDMVPAPGEEEKAARSLQEAADSHHTLQGFEAINNERFSKELEEEAARDNPEYREKGHPVP